ncbi:hypothetical protein AC068_16475 [Morganella morganii]|nr:hypothetical protein AC068_16475 [Morganella morganii]
MSCSFLRHNPASIPVYLCEFLLSAFLYRRLMISAEFCCVFYIHHQEDKYALYYLTYFYYL